MDRKFLRHATLNVASRKDEGVERASGSKAPIAFRIWRAGENKCDDGSIFFTEESAKRLMTEQASKDRPLSIDFDHLSLANDRPAEAGRAAGYHRLEARSTDAGPELWAVDVEWCADVKAGLEEEPPRWRYFSPAFYTDPETNAVTSYINLALCINPMTHGIPLLASRKLTTEAPMTAEEMLSQLDAMIEATQDPDQKAALMAAREALATKKDVDAPADGDAPVVTDSSKGEGASTHAEGGDDDDKKKKDDDDDSKKSAAKTHAAKDPVAVLAAQVVVLQRDAEIGKIDSLLAKHPNLPAEFVAHCRKASLEDAKVMITSVVGASKKSATRHATTSQSQNDGTAVMDPRDADFMDRSMGVGAASVRMPEKLSDGRMVMHTVRPSDLARHNAQKAKV